MEIPGFNAIRAISLIVFSCNINNIPIKEKSIRKNYTLNSVKSRGDWIN